MKRELFCRKQSFLLISLLFCILGSCKVGHSRLHHGAAFSFGIIADCQYCKAATQGQRQYAKSDKKLHACVSDLNARDLAWVIHLGDFIDRDWASFDVVAPIYDQLKMPAFHVLGNHDYSVADSLKAFVPNRLGLSNPYYSFEHHGWRFIVLNGNDISFHAYPEGSPQYTMAEDYYANNSISSPKWNGAIGREQLSWLEETLQMARSKREHVILFCHFPVYPEDVHNLWNDQEIVDLIEKYPNVKGYINGHNHKGNYGQIKGVHYLTMKGMVDTDTTSYGIMHVRKKRLQLSGIGREDDRTFKIRKN
ncbi:MAG: metallophosphoesterase [Saprospiraceae bacterium]|nr:metallophosphoesterase [Saprospiraceae bacterium]